MNIIYLSSYLLIVKTQDYIFIKIFNILFYFLILLSIHSKYTFIYGFFYKSQNLPTKKEKILFQLLHFYSVFFFKMSIIVSFAFHVNFKSEKTELFLWFQILDIYIQSNRCSTDDRVPGGFVGVVITATRLRFVRERIRAYCGVLQQTELRDAAVDHCNFRNESSYKSRGPATCAPAKLQLSGTGCNLSVMLLTIEVIGCTIIIPWVSGRSRRDEREKGEGEGAEAKGVAKAVMNAFTARGARENLNNPG